MEPQVKYTRTEDGVNIAYAEVGEGPALVIIPSPGVNHVQRDWTMFPAFYSPTPAFHLLKYDARGTGLSDREAIDFSLVAMLQDLETVVARTASESFALMAFQDGTSIAVTYAAKHPERVSHLILIDGWTAHSDQTGPMIEAHEALQGQDWTVYTETLARVLSGLEDPRLVELFGEHMRACIEPEAWHAFGIAAKNWDVSELLPAIKAPTLVLHNNAARFVPVRVGQKLAATIPDARFLALDDMNYERVPALISDFVGGAEGTAAPVASPDGLVTILFTDMEGSTTLADQLGDAAAQEVRRAHNDIVRGALAANGGNEIKHTGDGIMASFSTASSALESAIAIQRGVAAHKQEHPDSPLGVYVGLNAGEPIAEDDDLFGTSINVAARICDHAEAGQILAANVVRELAAGKQFLFADLGETELRGFEDPIKLWELRWQDGD